MDNRKAAIQFFEFLRHMIMSLCRNKNDDGELKELEFLANYIKDQIGDALQEYEIGNIPIMSYTVYGSRDGQTNSRFEIPRNIGIIQSWNLQKLAHLIDEAKTKWDEESFEQPETETDFDMSPYKLLIDEIKDKKGS